MAAFVQANVSTGASIPGRVSRMLRSCLGRQVRVEPAVHLTEPAAASAYTETPLRAQITSSTESAGKEGNKGRRERNKHLHVQMGAKVTKITEKLPAAAAGCRTGRVATAAVEEEEERYEEQPSRRPLPRESLVEFSPRRDNEMTCPAPLGSLLQKHTCQTRT